MEVSTAQLDPLVQLGLAVVAVVLVHLVRGERDRLRKPWAMAAYVFVAFLLIGSTYGLVSGQAQRDCEASGRDWVRSDPHGASGPGWECD